MNATGSLEILEEPVSGEVELQWLDDALAGRSRAVMWQGVQGLSVPRSYRRHARLNAVCTEFAARGWPVTLRRSGGGVVPQGPGVLNLSLAYRVKGRPGELADRIYSHLCGVLARALAGFGIETRPGAVEGSFCDGRFNLAVGNRKIAGTAQYWRRRVGQQAVLAHALLLFDADVELLTERANEFEGALGSERRYRADAHTTVGAALRGNCTELRARLQRQIAAALDVETSMAVADAATSSRRVAE